MRRGRPIAAPTDRLLDAGRATFVAVGYAAAHMEDIAAAAKVTKPTLYARVGPKEELFTQTVAREAARLSDHLLRRYAAAARGTADEAVVAATDALFDYCADEREGFLLLFSTTIGGPAIDRDQLVLMPVRSGIADLIRSFFPAGTAPSSATLGVIAAMAVEATVESARSAAVRGETSLEHARRLACAVNRTLLLARDSALWEDQV